MSCSARQRGTQPQTERSLSGFVLLLGLKRKLEGLRHHTVYFSRDYRAEFAQLFDEGRFPEDPTVYVCAPSRTDPGTAPEGWRDALRHGERSRRSISRGTRRQTEEARARVFERLSKGGFPDIAS